MSDPTWAERVEAAIDRAAAFTEEGSIRLGPGVYLTTEEVALAKALWEALRNEEPTGTCDGCTALRAFVEKVEAL